MKIRHQTTSDLIGNALVTLLLLGLGIRAICMLNTSGIVIGSCIVVGGLIYGYVNIIRDEK
jgi:hypothetical protein